LSHPHHRYFLSLHEQPHSLSRLDSASDQALRRSLENKHGVPTLHKRKQARASAISELEATEQASQVRDSIVLPIFHFNFLISWFVGRLSLAEW
jgi:hypothetical protein